MRFPIPKYYQQYATQDGNPVPTTGRLFLLLPPNFDPRRVWPILIVTATKDPGHTGPSDAPWYRAAAAAEGCIVLATDATVRPRNDSVAGISGGAKCAQWLGAILAQTHSLNIRGFFLSGINEDQMPEALKTTPRLLDLCVCRFGSAAELTIVSQPRRRSGRSKVHWPHRFSERPIESIQGRSRSKSC